MSELKNNLGLVYFVLPYIAPVENKLALILSIIIGREYHIIKFVNVHVTKNYYTMRTYLRYAMDK